MYYRKKIPMRPTFVRIPLILDDRIRKDAKERCISLQAYMIMIFLEYYRIKDREAREMSYRPSEDHV